MPVPTTLLRTRAKVGDYIIASGETSCCMKALKDHGVLRIDGGVKKFFTYGLRFLYE